MYIQIHTDRCKTHRQTERYPDIQTQRQTSELTDQHPNTDDSHSDGQIYRHLDIQTDSHKERQISRNPKIHTAVLNAVRIDQGLTACMAA